VSEDPRRLSLDDRVTLRWTREIDGAYLEDGTYLWAEVMAEYGDLFRGGEPIVYAGFLFEHDCGTTIELATGSKEGT